MTRKKIRRALPETGLTPAFDALPPGTNRRELKEAMRLLQHAIRTELTERQRTCFLLYHRDDLTMQEIADRTGITRGMVCRHIHKAEEHLRRCLKYSHLGAKLL